MMAGKILFVDRDGTLIEEPDDFQVDAVDKVRLVAGVIPALLELLAHGYRLVIVTNQDGLGTTDFPKQAFQAAHDHMLALFSSQGIEFDDVLVCPHREIDGCDCRKPRTGLLTRFLAANHIDLGRSAMVGDRDTDLQLAERIGVRGFRVNNPRRRCVSPGRRSLPSFAIQHGVPRCAARPKKRGSIWR